jgi:hypothetical protein
MVQFNESVKLFRLTLDATLIIDRHVGNPIRRCTDHMRALQNTRSLHGGCKMDAHSILTSRRVYAKGSSYDTPESTSNRRKIVLARVVCHAPQPSGVTELRQPLHCSAIRQRIIYGPQDSAKQALHQKSCLTANERLSIEARDHCFFRLVLGLTVSFI